MLTLVHLAPVELGTFERLRVLGIRDGRVIPGHRGKFRLSARGHGLPQFGFGVGREELPRRAGPELLAHEQHGRVGLGEQPRGGRDRPVHTHAVVHPVPGRAVAHLVVVLQERHELPRPLLGRIDLPAVGAAPERGVRPVVEVRRVHGLLQDVQGCEVPVVPVGLPGERHVRGVVDVVEPLRVHAQTVPLRTRDHAGIVEVGFRDGHELLARALGLRRDALGDLLQDVRGAGIGERMHGIQAEPVHVVVAQPHGDVVQDVLAHPVRTPPVQVDQVPPAGGPGLEVLREERQVVPAGSQVVVDHVLDHGDALGVARVHEPLIGLGPAVGLVHGVPGDAVVAPVVVPVEPVDGQQFHGVHAEVHEVVQLADRRVERALRGERPGVQFIKHRVPQRTRPPRGVVPFEGVRVERAGQIVHTLRLAA